MILYDIVFIIFSIFYIPYSIYKKGFRSFNLKGRLGFIPPDARSKLAGQRNIWIHAVSVGEIMVLEQFVAELVKSYPDYAIVISTTTETGYKVAKENLSNKAIVIYSPLDLSFVVKRFIRLIRPKVFIIVETELWPNLLGTLKKQGTGIVMINGRISPRSFKRYLIAKPFLKPTLNRINLFCMQSQADADRIKSIGAAAEKVIVTGNMKFDVDITGSRVQGPGRRELLGLAEKDILLVAGSTHKGEEEILLGTYKDLRKDFSNLRLLIAPRHIQRTPQIEVLAKRKGFVSVRISKVSAENRPLDFARGREPGTENQIFLLDTIGQLKDFYRIADIVFIGGSLIPHGGQNPIEPAYFSKPVIFGPFMFNFKEIAKSLLEEGAAAQVKNKEELSRTIASLIVDPKKVKAMGFFAKKAIEKNKGASEKNLQFIKKFL